MRRTFILALAITALCLFASTAAAHDVQIVGPSEVWVPFQQCVTATWTASPSGLDTFEWKWNNSVVGTASSYSRTWCNPNFDFGTAESGSLKLYATENGVGDDDQRTINIFYEAGNENGGCGYVMC